MTRTGPRRRLLADVAEGLRWLARHRLLRGLATLTAVANLVFAGTEAVLVLFAQERLGLGAVGFGLLLTGSAAGSLAASLLAARLARRFGAGPTYLLCVALLAVVLAVLAATRSVPVAAAALVVLGFATTAGNVILQSLRQAVTPGHMLGRVVSTYRMLGMGSVPLGALLGGLLGRVDLRLPYVVGAVVLALAWVGTARLLRGGAMERARAEAAEPAPVGR